MNIHFVFIGEGTSDDGLIPHLENLCIELGADEVIGTPIDFQRLGHSPGRTVESKLKAAIQLEPNANLWFVHRDADSRDPQPRYDEIAAAVNACNLSSRWVGIVPIQETEAWLLLDETAIREVAARPSGRNPLNLPSPRHVEDKANPKELLQEALIRAASVTGRKLPKFRADFSAHRKQLLQNLPTDGSLHEVKSWIRMRDDLQTAIESLRDNSTTG